MAKKVYLYGAYEGCQSGLPNVELLSSPICQVCGASSVDSIVLKDGSRIDVDGVFCLRGAVAAATLLPGLKMDGPHIWTDRNLKTNLAGCFAAGDCTGRPYQLAKAVGEGNIAAHSMIEYLSE